MKTDVFGIDRVAEFSDAVAAKLAFAGHKDLALLHTPATSVDTAPDDSIDLAIKLLREEVQELEDALWNEDAAQALKEAADVQYVLSRLVYVLGMSKSFPVAFNRVATNNNAKVVYGVIREDGKLIKPDNHPKVHLTDLVETVA